MGQSTHASGSELKWSKSAIEMSKTRADECQSQGKISHTRPNGTTAVNIVGTYSLENLAMAWGQKQTMLDAVNSWYTEKEAYLEHIRFLNGETTTDTTKQWGHYSTLIGNEFTSVGLGTVYYQGTTQYGMESITAGEFSNATDYVDQYQEKTEDKTDDKDTVGIHNIFKAKDDSKLERFKERIFNQMLYRKEAIDVSDIDINESEIIWTNALGTQITGQYATRYLIQQNEIHSTASTDYTKNPEFTYKDNGNVETVKITYSSMWTFDFIKKVIAGYDAAMNSLNSNDSDFAKALKLHDWIVQNVAYGDRYTTGGYAANAFANRKAVCEGFAYAYQFLLRQVGVESIYVGAKTPSEQHAWNLVKIDGHYFHVDCTWNVGTVGQTTGKHKYFLLNDEEFNKDGRHGEYWKESNKYPKNNLCSIENKFYMNNDTGITSDDQIANNPLKIHHEYDSSTTYNTSATEHWRTCVAGVEVHEKHDGTPCSICHYHGKEECNHHWENKHDDTKHWQECSVCKEKQNEENHTPSTAWKNDGTNHWHECTVCTDVKLDKAEHSWTQQHDKTYHWKKCSVCGYETAKEKHTPSTAWKNDGTNHWHECTVCTDVKLDKAEHSWTQQHDKTYHWKKCSICGYETAKEKHTPSTAWKNDGTNHWHECTVCTDVKLDKAEHSWTQQHDKTYHWKKCSICGYETAKEKHNGNPCGDCKYEDTTTGGKDNDSEQDNKLETKPFTLGSNQTSTFRCTRSFDKFVDILIDGKEVPKEYYTARSGSTIVEISSDYLNTLNKGKHTVTFRYTDKNVEGEFEIVGQSNETTPDDKKEDDSNKKDDPSNKDNDSNKKDDSLKPSDNGKKDESSKDPGQTGEIVSGKTDKDSKETAKVEPVKVTEAKNTTVKAAAKTGDQTNVLYFMALLVASLLVVLSLIKQKFINAK